MIAIHLSRQVRAWANIQLQEPHRTTENNLLGERRRRFRFQARGFIRALKRNGLQVGLWDTQKRLHLSGMNPFTYG